jgi:hypothetical protein
VRVRFVVVVSEPELSFDPLNPVAPCSRFFPIRGGTFLSLCPEAFVHPLFRVIAHAEGLPHEAAGMTFFEDADDLEASYRSFRQQSRLGWFRSKAAA